MSFTVKDLLELDVMKTAVLVAGANGLDHEIQFANVMETPEVAKFMKGGEFLISAGFAFYNERTDYRALIHEFADKKIAAFGINTGRYLESIPQEMMEEADKRGLPLLILPKDVPYMNIMIPVWSKTMNQRDLSSSRSKKFYNILLDNILGGRGFIGVTSTLSMLVSNPVYLLDANYHLLSGSLSQNQLYEKYHLNFSSALDFLKLSQLNGNLRLEPKPQRLHPYGEANAIRYSFLIMPIVVNQNLNGFLFIPELHSILEDDELLAIEDTGTIIALEMSKEKTIFDMKRRTQGEVLEDLLSGYYKDEEVFHRHLKDLEFQIGFQSVVAFIEIETDASSVSKGGKSTFSYDLKELLIKIIGDYAKRNLGGALLASRSDCVICLISLGKKESMNGLSPLPDLIRRNLSASGIKSIGISNPIMSLFDVKKAYDQAKIAAQVLPAEENLSLRFYQNTGIYLLLNEIKHTEAAKNFCTLYLKTLRDYDKKNDGELVKTLTVYFEQNRNLRKTAESLFVHKNSVIYRLNKIEQLTKMNLNYFSDRINLELGIYLMRVLDFD